TCTVPALTLELDLYHYHRPSTPVSARTLHDALPICGHRLRRRKSRPAAGAGRDVSQVSVTAHAKGERTHGLLCPSRRRRPDPGRSEEHTSELQSRENLVCRLLLAKKNNSHSITAPGS